MKGLVLIGGRSRRMGTDKAALVYHDQPEAQRCFALLESVCEAVYYSARRDQSVEGPRIEDPYVCGPMGGIVSALEFDASASWFVLACDLPEFSRAARDQLVNSADEEAQVILFETDRLQPLAALYQPAAYPDLKQALDQGQFSLQRTLAAMKLHTLKPEQSDWLKNINTPEDFSGFSAV